MKGIALPLALAALLPLACARTEGKTVVVGHYGPMSGAEATFGQSTARGIRLAIKEVNGSGGLKGLFKLYEQSSGIPYDRDATMYYRVQQNVRGMIPIHAVTVMAHPREPVAWFLAYRYIGDRAPRRNRHHGQES